MRATFDLAGPLPTGTTVLEASAGTGKTFTIAALVARWVAETDVALPDVLVVTFTRAATAELRDRVRDTLVLAHDHLVARAAGARVVTDNPVLAALEHDDPGELERRRARLARALADFDAATIATIHGFCQHVLDGLGVAGRLDRDLRLVEEHDELVDEVVDDVLLRTRLADPAAPVPSRRELREIGRAVVHNPLVVLEPASTDHPGAALRVRLAAEVRCEVERRARAQQTVSYDDLLVALDRTLQDPDTGPAAAAALRARYQVVLVDEFQDTDPVQWRIFRTAFVDVPTADPARATVLIGDPKQAIYAFRGADVHAYLEAAAHAGDLRTLSTSWRSDAPLLSALEVLLDGATFGHDRIAWSPVTAAPGRATGGLQGGPTAGPVRIRRVTRDLVSWPRQRDGDLLLTQPVKDLVAADVAAQVVELLEGAAGIATTGEGDVDATRPLQPRDVAVLVRTHDEARIVHDALRAVDVPAVVGGARSVLLTDAAEDWQRLLDALERPSSVPRVRALALSAWVGWDGNRSVAATEAEWDRLHEQVQEWAELLGRSGLAAVQRDVLRRRDVRQRLLARHGGERLLADLVHLGEVLHVEATRHHVGATALAGRLRDLRRTAGGTEDMHRLRRLETDDEAVQVLTVHGSKGLEFAVVLCPYLWTGWAEPDDVAVFHADGRRRLDVGGPDHPARAANAEAAARELRGEQLRLLYVALTRARHHLVAWYAPSGHPEWAGLPRLLLNRDHDLRPRLEERTPDVDDAGVAAAVARLVAASGGTITDELVPAVPSTRRWRRGRPPTPALSAARLTRRLDLDWRRTSYSALAHTEVTGVVRPGDVDTDVTVTDDEALVPGPPDGLTGAPADDVPALPSPLGDLAGGAAVGTLVHAVLEHTDFTAADLHAALRAAAVEQEAAMGTGADLGVLVDGLAAVVATPLGPVLDDLRLRDVTRTDRRDEVVYELPLGGPRGAPRRVGDLLALLDRWLPSTDPLAGYPARVPAEVAERPLRGQLNGSIDLLLRRRRADGSEVFHVVDHKTNWLGPGDRDEPLTTRHYTPAAMADAMVRGHYPLQALLYSVAVHRLLRWRVPDYDPARHLGEVLYLFVRGMAGPDTPVVGGMPTGVFTWSPPAGLVTAASDLLAGGDGP